MLHFTPTYCKPAIQPRLFRSERLTLIATTFTMIEAELRSPGELAKLLNAKICPGWPPGDYDRTALEFLRDCLAQGGIDAIGWHGWYALRTSNRELVGAGGYHGPPSSSGRVEIGYSIHTRHERRGYATELVHALLKMAFDHRQVQSIIAHTAQDNHASRAVLLKNGFRQIGGLKYDNTLRFERQREEKT